MVKADELVKQQKERNKLKDKIYNKVYKQIEKKIQMASNLNLYSCSYEIPTFLLGAPIYCNASCKKYLVKKLTKNGFKISEEIFNSSKLIISWNPN